VSHSSDLERVVLGALQFQPSLLENSDLCDSDFPAGRFRETFQAIADLWEEGRPAEIDPVILAERIGGNGVGEFVASLIDGSIKLNLDVFRGRVVELRKRAALGRIEARARAGLRGLDEIDGDLEVYKQLDQPAVNPRDVLIKMSDLQALEIHVEWVAKLLPEKAVTMFHGPGGLGKTWFDLQLAKAVSEGKPFLGSPTKKMPVTYVDFENPLAVMRERAIKFEIRDVELWHPGHALRLPPPKFDTPAWVLFKDLQPGLLILDSFRSLFDGDENASQDTAPVMNRFKELRDIGFTLKTIHHTGKANDRMYKGSTAISDLADNVLGLHTVKRETLEETEDWADSDPHALLSLGTAKTRFEPGRIFLTFDLDNGGYSLAPDPALDALDALAEYINGPGAGQNQSEIIAWAQKAIAGGRKGKYIALLNRGERERPLRWRCRKSLKGAKVYEPAS